MIGSKLHIIASCSGRKTKQTAQDPRIHTVRATTLPERHRAWLRLLETPSPSIDRADQLYAGDHAAVLRSTRAEARNRGFEAKLWVLSAGYGLVCESDLVRPYSATFANGDVDSISSRRDEKTEWWRLACANRPRNASEPINLAKLFEREHGSAFLIVASPRYVEAIEDDLAVALADTGSSTVIVISSAREDLAKKFPAQYLAVSADQASTLNGALSSLHARTAREIIINDLLDRPLNELRSRFGAVPGMQRKRSGKPLTDADVLKRIDLVRSQFPDISATRALRQLRDQGLACEQKRFGRLFDSTVGRRLPR